MRWLVYGAGNIGSLYAAKLAQSSQDVTILARGERARHLRDRGIVLEDLLGNRSATSIRVVEALAPDDDYGTILVVLPKTAIGDVLPALAAHAHPSDVLFFCNNAAGPRAMVDALGARRVLLGFPGAAAIPKGEAIRYLIMSAREQPTTIGELDGTTSPRIERIAARLRLAGFPVAVSSDMDAWLKTHAAEILPTAGALFRAGGLRPLARDRETLRMMLDAIREGHSVLRANGIAIMPKSHRLFGWLPAPLLMAAIRHRINDESMAIKIGHANQARAELQLLDAEFRPLVEAAGVPTPSLDALAEQLTPEAKRELAS